MSIVVPTHQVPMLPTVDLKLVSSPSPEHTVMNIAPQNAGHSPVIGAVTNLSPSAGISAPNKFPVAVGQKRKIEKLMQFPHDDLECNLTTEDLVAIAKTAVTLPPLPEPEHEFLTSIKVTPSPCRPIAKKLCLERNNVNICPQPVLQTNLQPFQNNPLQPRMMAPPKFRYPSLPEPILSSVMLPKPMSLTPGVMRITPRNSFTHIPPVGVIARTNKVTNATSAKRRGRNPASKPQMRYDPEVPMTKQEAAAWRREQRRVRNRESAALSRQKTRDRISELEMELKGWQKKYGDAMERVQTLEQQRQPRPSLSDAGGPTLILNSRPSQSNHQSSMISPTSSPSSSPVPFNNVVPQVVPSLSRVPPAAELSVSSCLIPLVLDSRVTHNSSSPPLQLLPQIYRSQVHNTDGAQNLVIAPQPQLVPISKTHQLMEQQLQRQKPEGQHFNETNLRPAVSYVSESPSLCPNKAVIKLHSKQYM